VSATILVVDDHAANRSVLVSLLGYVGHRVVEAADGREALALAQRERPSLVITDLLMPVMDGFDLARRLREDAALAAVPVVFYTATYVESDARALADACGVRHILTKPAEPEEILRVVGEILGGTEAAAPSSTLDFHQEHLRLLTMTLAHKAEVVVPRLNAVMALSLQLASQLDPVRLLDTFCEGMRGALGADWAIVILDRRLHDADRPLFASGLDAATLAGWKPEPAVAQALEEKRAVCVPADRPGSGLPASVPGTGSLLFAPIHSPGTRYGSLCLARATGAAPFASEEIDLAAILGGLVGRIYENGSLYAAARKQAEDLTKSEERFRQLADNIPEVFWIASVENGEAIYVSPAYETVWGRSVQSFYDRPASWLEAVVPEDAALVQAYMERGLCGEAAEEFRIRRPDGSVRWVWARSFPVRDAQGRLERLAGVTLDITDRRNLDQQFRQAQKMEAVGRLAGGVAHDFNNLLGVVMGYGESALRALPADHAVRPKIDQILRAAERATGVTRQLLLFSRKHVAEPRLLDLNAVVRDMERILHRLIGEDLELVVVCGTAIGTIRADVREVEQVLMNLAVNARDAMPHGGRLVIETSRARVGPVPAAGQEGIRPGDYVRVSVADTGTGIPNDVRPHIFEPFFTTKAPEHGTGLGLSTVYGIVSQAKGHIVVDGQEGGGTTFTVYFPDVAGTPERAEQVSTFIPEGRETVLLVEDDDALRSVTAEMLRECGYAVLECANGPAAERLVAEHVGEIHLLLTDVVLPGQSGPETAERILGLRPGTKVLFVSGYTGGDLTGQRVLPPDSALLQKPFTIGEMARKVREALDGPAPPGDR
jgi:PAS domain S-box-containing protein